MRSWCRGRCQALACRSPNATRPAPQRSAATHANRLPGLARPCASTSTWSALLSFRAPAVRWCMCRRAGTRAWPAGLACGRRRQCGHWEPTDSPRTWKATLLKKPDANLPRPSQRADPAGVGDPSVPSSRAASSDECLHITLYDADGTDRDVALSRSTSPRFNSSNCSGSMSNATTPDWWNGSVTSSACRGRRSSQCNA